MEGTRDEDTGIHSGEFAETPSDKTADISAEDRRGSGWVTTEVAAAALGVTARTVREYIKTGRLQAKAEGKGVNKTWLVSIDDVQKLRESRRSMAETPRNLRRTTRAPESAEASSEITAETMRELITRLEVRTAEAANFKARLELTAHAESTLREALDRERERADRAEEELRKLRRRLEMTSEPQEAPGTVGEDVDRSEEVSPEAQESEKRRSWLYRFFFGP